MVDFTLVFPIVGVVALVILNGVFVAAEFALVRVRRTRLEELAGQGRQEAKHAIELVDQVGEYLTTTQVGITVASLGVGWLGEGAIARLLKLVVPVGPASSGAILHGISASLAFFLVTMLLVVVGEILPKNLAIMTTLTRTGFSPRARPRSSCVRSSSPTSAQKKSWFQRAAWTSSPSLVRSKKTWKSHERTCTLACRSARQGSTRFEGSST